MIADNTDYQPMIGDNYDKDAYGAPLVRSTRTPRRMPVSTILLWPSCDTSTISRRCFHCTSNDRDKDHEQSAWDSCQGKILCGCRDAVFALLFLGYIAFCVGMTATYGRDTIAPPNDVERDTMHAVHAMRPLFGPIAAACGVAVDGGAIG